MPEHPQLPPNFKDTVEDTRDLVNGLISRVAAVAGNAGNKWIDGFSKDDVLAVAKDAGDQFTQQVADAWKAAEDNVKPPKDGNAP